MRARSGPVALAGVALVLLACGSGSARRRRSARRPPSPPPVVSAPPSACPPVSTPEPELAALLDGLFRAHAEGRIAPELLDAQGAPVPQTPLATELVCPRTARTVGPGRVALRLGPGATGEEGLDTEVTVVRRDARLLLSVDSLARMRTDLQAFGLRRFLAGHPELEQLAALDVPFEDDFADASGSSPRRRAREATNLRLAFARAADGTTLCLLVPRGEGGATRSACWHLGERLDRVVTGMPMIVDQTVQVQLVLVPLAPAARAEVVELRLTSGLEARRLYEVSVRRAPIVPVWAGRVRDGVVLEALSRPRPAAWAPVALLEGLPSWVPLLSSTPWLRAVPVTSPTGEGAVSVTTDREESRRWLGVHTAAGWAFTEALDRPSADGLTSWDGVEPAPGRLGTPEGTFLAWSSDYGDGRGTARVQLLRLEGERLVAVGDAPLGAVRAWWSADAPVDPVAERLGPRAPDVGPHRVAWRAWWSLAGGGVPGCIRLEASRADVSHVTPAFQAIAAHPVVPMDPTALPEAVTLGPLPTGAEVDRLVTSRCPGVP